MRLFFGLRPDARACLDIDRWRERTLPPLAHPVPLGNLHLTLAFLGEVRERDLEFLTDEVGLLRSPPIEMFLDQLGYYPKPQVLWIGPGKTPEAAISLTHALRHICRRLGLRTERREFQAHMTIARRCVIPPPASAEPPAFALAFDSFVLFESVNTRRGVQYREVRQWALD